MPAASHSRRGKSRHIATEPRPSCRNTSVGASRARRRRPDALHLDAHAPARPRQLDELHRMRHRRAQCGLAASRSRRRKRWILPVEVFGSSAMNSIWRGYLNGASRVLDEGLEFGLERGRRAVAGLEHDEGLGPREAFGVGHADHRRLQHRGMLHQRGLDLERRHVLAADLEHVVAAARVGVGAVGIAHVLVAALGPRALEGVARLVAVAPVHQRRARAADVEVADLAVGHRAAVVAAQLDRVAGHRLAGAAVVHVARTVGQEDVQHLGGADAVDQLAAEVRAEALAEFARQRLAGRRAQAQRHLAALRAALGETSMPA